MASRMFFIARPDGSPAFREAYAEFAWYSGFAVSQKQKSILSFHEAIRRSYPNVSLLEISTKSTEELGVALSAFNLMFCGADGKEYPLENIFQSSKVFANGGPYRDLLGVHPKDAKRDERLRTSGKLLRFEYDGKEWPLLPKTIFYDWIYITALKRRPELAERLLDFGAFTDIEFNPENSVNCQARAAAIYVALAKSGRLDIVDTDEFATVYARG